MHTSLSALYVVTLPPIAMPVGTWLQRVRTRAALRELDERALADIGRSEAERERECGKWFWEA
jgi:uncharacterized protein YjiS (DUF1127 family)